jgi:hypothetical protein
VDNNILRMAQAADGNWYGYFGEITAVRKADFESNNLDFGAATAVGVVSNTTGPVFSNQALDGYGGGVLNAAPTLLSNHTQTNLLNGQIGLDVTGNRFMGVSLAVSLNGALSVRQVTHDLRLFQTTIRPDYQSSN